MFRYSEPELTMSKKPILYMHPLSPPARAVMLAAAELGIDLELKPVDLLGLEHKKPEFVKVNSISEVFFSINSRLINDKN